MNLQIASDLHLEFYDFNKYIHNTAKFEEFLRPSAPILVLAGDIGYPKESIYKDFIFT